MNLEKKLKYVQHKVSKIVTDTIKSINDDYIAFEKSNYKKAEPSSLTVAHIKEAILQPIKETAPETIKPIVDSSVYPIHTTNNSNQPPLQANFFEIHWSRTKAALLDGLEDPRKKVLEILLENTKRELTNNNNIYEPTKSVLSTALLNKIVLPILCRIIHDTGLFNLISIQPITGALGSIYAKENSKITKQMVEVTTNFLKHKHNVEVYTLNDRTPIDIEAEELALLAYELIKEIEQTVISKLKKYAIKNTIIYDDFSSISNIISDQHSNLIHKETGWVLISKPILKKLEKEITLKPENLSTSKCYVGELRNGIKIYVNTENNSNDILIGSKATTLDTDAVAVYAPYLIINANKHPTIDNETFNPEINFTTRSGFYKNNNDRILKNITVVFPEPIESVLESSITEVSMDSPIGG